MALFIKTTLQLLKSIPQAILIIKQIVDLYHSYKKRELELAIEKLKNAKTDKDREEAIEVINP